MRPHGVSAARREKGIFARVRAKAGQFAVLGLPLPAHAFFCSKSWPLRRVSAEPIDVMSLRCGIGVAILTAGCDGLTPPEL